MTLAKPMPISHTATSIFHRLPPLCLTDAKHLGVPDWLRTIEARLDAALRATGDIRAVVAARCMAMDSLLCALLAHCGLTANEVALVATGGYGRGELHPYSDVDCLIITADNPTADTHERICQFAAHLWDSGITPALAVRSRAECATACADITVATSLLEARVLLAKNAPDGEALLSDLRHMAWQAWSAADFFCAKMTETRARYRKHDATESNLEPDIKHAPGGLRDIQTVRWIGLRYFAVANFEAVLATVTAAGFITANEYQTLHEAEGFLWQVRHHLHHITGRNENRLLFDYQRNVAERMGYHAMPDDRPNAAVERMMRDYYRRAMAVSTLCELICQYAEQTLFGMAAPKVADIPLNAQFVQRGEQIIMRHADVFVATPSAMLSLFLLMGQHDIKYIETATVRALITAAPRIDDAFRQDPYHRGLFMANLVEQNLLFHRLQAMKRYGVLGRYIPAFSQITGLMQYDLFHRYTVDAHTLRVVRVLHRFTDARYTGEYPLVSSIYRGITRKVLLTLAALFHDIAKGRGGDHSELGQAEALAFCTAHELSTADSQLVAWLVEQHLLMSMTAQKKDTSDPHVIATFAEAVGDVTHLNYLYALTVADMTATNAQIWNSWRATLLRQLYHQTRRLLLADGDASAYTSEQGRKELVYAKQARARTLLQADPTLSAADLAQIDNLWQALGEDYFLREIAPDIVWHAKAIIAHAAVTKAATDVDQSPTDLSPTTPLIALREHHELALDAVQVFIYTPDQPNLFAVTVAVLDAMQLDVLDARVITSCNGIALDSYVVLDRQNTLLVDTRRQETLRTRLQQGFASQQIAPLIDKNLPRKLRHFDVPTRVEIRPTKTAQQYTLAIETLDQPSLLARVSRVLLAHEVAVQFARITTLGERAEDMFIVRTPAPLAAAQIEALTHELVSALATPTNHAAI